MQKMKVRKRILAAGLSLTSYLLAAAPVFAAWPPTDPFLGKNICDIITLVINALFGLAAAVAVVVLIIGGYQYMTSGGDKMAVSDARGRITGAVVGLFIALGAYLLIRVLMGILEVPLGCTI